ncbi:hypothetical protein HDU93_009926 [Gonapodya sp. JEL0774]|nr:hypothetical protein HDU93_009926 [Gonapodya sp. JEL0774]
MSDFHWQDFDVPVMVPSLFTKDISIESRVHAGSGERARICFVVCHPYGPMGGNFQSNIVVTLSRAFADLGFSTARFNFRGVGLTGGETSRGGDSEEGDLKSVCAACALDGLVDNWRGVEKFVLVGYSYGAMITGSAASTLSSVLPPHLASPLLAWISISYPYSALNDLTLYQGFLVTENAKKIAAPKLLITGADDEFTSVTEHAKFAATLADPKTVVEVPDEGHFWQGAEEDLVRTVVDWLKSNVEGLEDCDRPLPSLGESGESNGPRL